MTKYTVVSMGGNTFNRRWFSNNELTELVQKINGYQSLFDDRIFETERAWRANISRHLDADSSNRFYYKIEELKGLPQCHACKATLGVESFDYAGDVRGFRKYCPCCTQREVWKLSENCDPGVLKERGNKISKKKLEFYQTEQGKQIASSNGRKISKSLIEFHKTEKGEVARKKSAEHNSVLMRNRILSGEFTPSSNNRNTHWESVYKNKKYRSSWEAFYQHVNPNAEYESLRILYSYNDKELIYVVDFVDHTNKIVTEVKPVEQLNAPKTVAKIAALRNWAEYSGYIVEIFTLESIKSCPEPDYSLFDEKTVKKLKKIYATTKN